MTPTFPLWRTVAALLLATLARSAGAHVVLEQPHATTGQSYKAVLVVSHGCAGQPTHTVTVRIPPGFRGAKPMPKPGWTLAVKRAPLAEPYVSHGRTVTEDAVEIAWTARSVPDALADAHHDEFVLRGQIAAAPGPMWFQVRQDCPAGQLDWREIPADGGTSTQGLKAPAALLRVEPGEAAPLHH